eukprot:8782873-Pyramimonas_sp.AAC.2
MFQLNQIIEIHGGATKYAYDRVESASRIVPTTNPVVDRIEYYLRFQFRFGTETETHNIPYNHTHTWARDLPICIAEHFFKKMLHFLDPESVQGTTAGIVQWI